MRPRLIVAVLFVGIVARVHAQQTAPWRHDAGMPIGFYELTPFGTLLVSTDARTVALKPDSGEVVWSTEDLKGCSRLASSTVVTCSVGSKPEYLLRSDPGDPILLFTNPESHIVVFDLETGQRRWDTGRMDVPHERLHLDRLTGVLLLTGPAPGRSALEVTAVNVLTGERRWQAIVPDVQNVWGGCIESPPLLPGCVAERQLGAIMFTSRPETDGFVLAALDVDKGNVRWNARVPLVADVSSDVIRGIRIFHGKTRAGGKAVVGVRLLDGRVLFQSNELGELFSQSLVRFAASKNSLGDAGLDLSAGANSPDLDFGESPWRDLEIVNNAKKQLTAIDLNTGAVRWRPKGVDLESISSAWAYDSRSLYVNHGGKVSAINLSDGSLRWTAKSEKAMMMSLTRAGLMVGCSLERCAGKLDLLDPSTGARKWSKTASLPAGLYNLLSKSEDLLLAGDRKLLRLNLASGEMGQVGQYTLQALVPKMFIESSRGFVLLSDHSVVVLGQDGAVRAEKYYPPPGPSFGQSFLRSVAAGGLSALNSAVASSVAGQAARQNAYINAMAGGPGVGYGTASYFTYFPSLRTRSLALQTSGQYAYWYTESPDAKGRRGFSFVRFDPEEGRERGRAWVDQRNPEMRFDPASSVVFVKQDNRTIVGLSFEE